MSSGPLRATAAVLALGALCAGVAACGSSSSSAKSAPTSPSSAGSSAAATTPDLSGVTVKVAVFAGQGYDVELKAAGLDDTPYKVSYQTYQDGGSITRAVAQGTADFGPGSGIANTLLEAAGGKFTSIATINITGRNQDTIVPKGSKITSLADLKGKKVAYIPNSTSEYILLKQLQSVGLSFADIKPVPLDPASGLSALLGGSVDASVAFGPTETVALSKGATVLASGEAIFKGTLGALAGSENVGAGVLADPKKAAAVADYVARINTASAWARANPDKWAAIIAAKTNQPLAAALANFKGNEADVPTVIGPVQQAAVTDQQAIADTFLKAGIIKVAVNASSTYSTQLTDQITADQKAYTTKYPQYFTTGS